MFVARVNLVTTADGRQMLIDQLSRETTETPANFAGCERFDVSVSSTDPHRVRLLEEWTSREAFDLYRESDFFAHAMAKLGPCLAEPPDSAYYDAVKVGP
jgi:quinol monooxygenase YgiN